jgi:hypothetical protein
VRQNHFQQHGPQIWRIVDGNAKRGGEQTRFVFALYRQLSKPDVA